MTYRLIDSSNPYRFPGELIDLIQAVVKADPNAESTWIEWKSTLELGDKSGQQHIAKHVLGFANRTVGVARAHAGGYAYLVAGASPGEIAGIAGIDPAVLVPRIVRYVGRRVRWRPEYVTVDGKQVLVVVVDPPEPGDPIHPLRAQLDSHPKGRILVRRAGATDVADDAEIDALMERVQAGKDSLNISLHAIASVIERRTDFAAVEDLVAAERAAVLARPRADTPKFAADPLGAFGALAQAQQALMAATRQPDRRTEEDYAKQIDHYMAAHEEALAGRFALRMWRHLPASVQLELVNETDGNFTALDIELHVPGDVHPWPRRISFADDDEEGTLPVRPLPLGTAKVIDLYGINTYFNPAGLIGGITNPRPVSLGPTVTVGEAGSVTVSFSGINLRPRQRKAIPIARIMVDEQPGAVLDCDWVATASNVNCQVTGRVSLTVASSTLDLAALDWSDHDDSLAD